MHSLNYKKRIARIRTHESIVGDSVVVQWSRGFSCSDIKVEYLPLKSHNHGHARKMQKQLTNGLHLICVKCCYKHLIIINPTLYSIIIYVLQIESHWSS
jgi:hypothetical protein